MSTTLENPKNEKKGEKVRVLGTIITDPVTKTSKSGNPYTKLVLATSNGGEVSGQNDVIWNLTVMDKLRQRCEEAGYGGLFTKFAFAKFSGLGSKNTFVYKKGPKTGQDGVSFDLLVDSITMPDGNIIYQSDKKPRADEDAPF